MPGYRGIFLDSIHPNIVQRLEKTRLGFTRKTFQDLNLFRKLFQRDDDLALYRYIQERTPWMRAVPFSVPDPRYATDDTFNMEGIAPYWKDWILYGIQSDGSVPIEGVGENGVYRPAFEDWAGRSFSGYKNSPRPGITAINVSNKGDLGTIRRATIDIKAYNLSDLEALEMMYMIPGMSVLIEFGWYHSKLYVDPIDIELLDNGQLANKRAINEAIVKKEFAVDDLLNFDLATISQDKYGPEAGIYDGLLGVVTKFNWNNNADGTYNVRIDVISPGSLATGIPTDSYILGATQRTELKGGRRDVENVPVTDADALCTVVAATTRGVAAEQLKAGITENLESNYNAIQFIDVDTGGDVVEVNEGVEINLPSKKLDMEGASVKITKGSDGQLVFEPVEEGDAEGIEYYIGQIGNGKSYNALTIKGNNQWWKISKENYSDGIEWSGNVERDGLAASPDEDFWVNDYDDPEQLLQAVDQKYGRDLEKGNYYITKADHDRGWDIVIKHKGVWEDQPFIEDDTLNPDKYFNARRRFLNYQPDYRFGFRRSSRYAAIFPDRPGGVLESKGKDKNGRWNLGNVRGDQWFFPKASNLYRPTVIDPSTGKTVKFIERVSGYSSELPEGVVRKPVEDDTDQYEVKDAAGNTVIEENEWGSNVGDPVVFKKRKGVSIYKKNPDGSTELVASEENQDQQGILNELKKQIRVSVEEQREEIDIAAQESVAAAADLVQTIRNNAAVSWGPIDKAISFDVSVGSSAGSYKRIISTIKPINAPEIEIPYNPEFQYVGWRTIGTVAYGETYVSMRYIEDYIVNELFMPKIKNQTADDKDDSHSLEQLFSTTTPMSKEDKIRLAEQSNGLIKLKDGAPDKKSLETYMVSSDYIYNHPQLRSFDPNVCILPGQESLLGTYNRTPMFDKFLPEFHDTFAPKDGNNAKDFNSGIFRNIQVNINVVRAAVRKSQNVRKFMLTILDEVNKACGEPWSFKIQTVEKINQLKVVDENYVANPTRRLATRDVGGDARAYLFSGIGSDNICKDVKIQTKIPSELQTMAYYSSLGESVSTDSRIQMFNMYRIGMVDYLKLTSQTYIATGTTTASKEEIDKGIVTSYYNLLIETRYEALRNYQKTPATNEGRNIAKEFVKRFMKGQVTPQSGYRPPLPIDVSITLDGISGLYMGNAVSLKTIDEGGLLPSRYRGRVALQITSVDHSITPESWTTSFGTLMRPVSNSDTGPGIIPEVEVEIDPPGGFPNANKLRKVIAELKTDEYNIFEKKKASFDQGELSSGGDITARLAKKSEDIFTRLRTALIGTPVTVRLTGGNDKYHQQLKNSNSVHKYGKGMDFTIQPYNANTRAIVEEILGNTLGVTYINEYENPTINATAKHFHYRVT